MREFITKGTCSSKIHFDIRGGRVYSLSFEDGCDGNLKALSRLIEGMKTEDVIAKLKGLDCDNRGTSCADQLARALEAAGPA
jgi:uncharacterized protein (TIGR03905 family)